MPTNETEDLVRSIVEGLSARNINLDYASAGAPVLQVVERVTSGSTQSGSDAGRLASEVEQLRNVVTQTVTATQSPGESDKGGSTAETVLKTIGMVTGMGPIAAGLMTLFGSRSSETSSFPTMPFEAPSSIAVDAGLTADRQLTGVSYAADGTARSTASNAAGGNANRAVPPIQINVQAMDSRSFLDHSDDIARAVREAMLHSHALNDVVSEL